MINKKRRNKSRLYVEMPQATTRLRIVHSKQSSTQSDLCSTNANKGKGEERKVPVIISVLLELSLIISQSDITDCAFSPSSQYEYDSSSFYRSLADAFELESYYNGVDK